MKKRIITALLLGGWLLLPCLAAAQTGEAAAPAETTEASGSAGPAAEGSAAGTATPDQLWDLASTAYLNGDYPKAIAAYESLVEQGWSSAKLYYNLANAYFKEERLSRAILFYRRALRLDPGDADTRYNLSVAEARTKDKIEQVPEFFLTQWFRSIRRSLGCTAWSILSLVLLAAGLGLFLLFLLAPLLSWRRTGLYGALTAALLFVLTTAFAVGERRSMLDRSEAVVTASSASVKSAPDNAATDLFVLHEGTPVRITDRLDRWCEVTIADGKKGWVEQSKIEII